MSRRGPRKRFSSLFPFCCVFAMLALRRRAPPEDVQRLDGAGLVRLEGQRPLEEGDGPLPVPQARLEERQIVQGRGIRSLRLERRKPRECPLAVPAPVTSEPEAAGKRFVVRVRANRAL